MTEFLKQTTTGHIYVATKALSKRDDMVPYEPKSQSESQEEVQESSEQEVNADDNVSLESMSKAELEEYAKENFDVELDKRKRREDLVAEVQELPQGE